MPCFGHSLAWATAPATVLATAEAHSVDCLASAPAAVLSQPTVISPAAVVSFASTMG